MRHSTTIDINAPAEKVWAIATQFERWPEWMGTKAKVERHGGARVEVGDRLRIDDPVQGIAVWTIKELIPGRSLKQQMGRWLMRAVKHTEIERISDSESRVTISLDHSAGFWPLDWLFSGVGDANLAKEAQVLRRLSEES